MTFFFSMSNNSAFVAKVLGKKLNDKVVNILDFKDQKSKNFVLKDNENLIFCFPIYFFTLPYIVKNFIRNNNFVLTNSNFVSIVCTYGSISGKTQLDSKKLFAQKKININLWYSIRMVDTFLPIFHIPKEAKIKLIESKALAETLSLAEKIKVKQSIFHDPTKVFYPLAHMYYLTYAYFRQTKFFRLEKTKCTLCGLCVNNCPEQTIVISEQKLLKHKTKLCLCCVKCVNFCPNKAMQYRRLTKDKGQYRHSLDIDNLC